MDAPPSCAVLRPASHMQAPSVLLDMCAALGAPLGQVVQQLLGLQVLPRLDRRTALTLPVSERRT
eukprot:45984-Eustigmatos_ZCMA.PRE.1